MPPRWMMQREMRFVTFSHSSAYVGRDAAESDHEELAARWREQRVLDSVIAAIVEGRDDETLALAPRFASRPSVFVGLLARMVQSGRARNIFNRRCGTGAMSYSCRRAASGSIRDARLAGA
jgi:hypothetical protein